MKGLSSTDAKILAFLKDYPQGVFLKQIAEHIQTEKGPSKQNARRYMVKLIKKGYARQAGKLYFGVVQSTIPFTPKGITTKQRHKRPHAVQINAKLYRTSAGRLRDTLQYLNIPYKATLKGNLTLFEWKGHQLRASRSWLYTHIDLPIAPLNVNISEIHEKAIRDIAPFFEALLAKTGLRCIRTLTGELVLAVHYWEDGYPGDRVAGESLKDKSRIVYAYDRKTGQPRAWADKSVDPFEFETNSERVDKEWTTYIQGIEDGEMKPYEDEMLHRDQEARIWSLLESYGQKLNAHLPVLEKMDKVLALDIQLKRRELAAGRHLKRRKDLSKGEQKRL
jgi:hypothetical protein